jgi:hypothetical protein
LEVEVNSIGVFNAASGVRSGRPAATTLEASLKEFIKAASEFEWSLLIVKA